jgi:hypothetical protein
VGIDQPERAKPALIPKHERLPSSLAGLSHVHHESHVIGRRRRYDEHEPCHPWLDHQPSLAGGKGDLEGQPLSKPFDGRKLAAADRGDDGGWSGRRADRSPGTAREFGPRDAAANEVEDPTAHRLYFGELRHGGGRQGPGKFA